MAKKTIKLKKYADVVNEYTAGEAITPGMLLTLAADGDVDLNASAGSVCEKMFAVEDELQGKTIDTDYAIADPVQCWTALPGNEVLAWLKANEDVAIGAKLKSGGDGTLVAVGMTGTAIAIATEAVDATGAVAKRISVRIL